MKKKNFKVFISYKNTDSDTGKLTQDYTMAKELYKELYSRDIKTFFAPVTLKEMGADGWDDEIKLALDQSDVMVLVVTNPKYIETPELMKEWPPFLDMINKEKRNKRFFVYKDGNFPMPECMARKQTFIYDRTDERVKEVIDHIENAIEEIRTINSEKNKITDTVSDKIHDTISPIQSMSEYEQNEFIEDFFSWYSKFNTVTDNYIETPLKREHFDKIINELQDSLHTNRRCGLLKFYGENGSGKSILLQLMDWFLKNNCHTRDKVHTLYIDLVDYYDLICQNSDNVEQLLFTKFNNLLNKFVNIAEKKNKIPVLFVVGLNNCNYGSISLDFCFYKVFDNFIRRGNKINAVVAIDDYRTQAPDRIFENPFERFNYKYELKSVSIPISDKACICEVVDRYVNFIVKYHNFQISKNQIKEIGKSVFSNSIYKLDFFILDLIIRKQRNCNSDFLSMVESHCNDSFYGNQNKKDFFAECAFNFTYGGGIFDDRKGVDNFHVIHIFKHNVIIHYLISYYYLKCFSKLNIYRDDIQFFEQILPKEITRFLMPMINRHSDIEEKIILFCETRHKDMTHLCQSEMHYFLGRIKSPRFKDRAGDLLKKLYVEFTDEFFKALESNAAVDILKQKAFLYRSLAVSLIYRKDNDITREYIKLLISDEISNEINRGFHLEYYGDKPFMPRLNSLDITDVTSVGEGTVMALLQSLSDLKITDGCHPTVELSFFTLCSLLQVRMDALDFPKSKLVEYIEKCLDIFPVYLRISNAAKDEKINAYFNMVQRDFREYLNEKNKNKADNLTMLNELFASLSSLSELDRAGWNKYSVPTPESVTEHMYNCWLLALLYLPDNYDADGYNKDSILKMLLIHDWAEAITGDINKPHKTHEDYQYEKKLMRMILLKGTYPSIANLSRYFDVWEEFESKFKNSENTKIAKDIDCIQALHQFCNYHIRHPEKFPDGVNEEWFDLYYNELKSSLGKELFKKIILDNPAFDKVIPSIYK